MQYKIPINIENEDPIIFWLSIRQLIIIIAWTWIWYWTYNSLSSYIWEYSAALPAIFIFVIWLAIAIFKYSEMTFMIFLLSLLRYWVNYKERYWQKWIDSFHALDIWYIVNNKNKVEKIDLWNKIEKIKTLEDQLKKI